MKKYWIGFSAVIVLSFAVLGWVGVSIYQKAPPIPDRVLTTDGRVVIEEGLISRGQNVWQALGGMEVGSVWGHGSYVAPDWSADWLHREAVFILDAWADDEQGKLYGALSSDQQAVLRSRLQTLMRDEHLRPRHRRADAGSGPRRRVRMPTCATTAISSANGRPEYAIPKNAQPDPEKLRALGAFFFWTSWATAANRPGEEISYTSNWPHEELVGNVPTADAVVWTGVSIILLLAGIGAMAWYYAAQERTHDLGEVPPQDPLLDATADTFTAGGREVLLDGHRSVPAADHRRRGGGALCGGRRCLLWHSAIIVPSVQHRADLAYTTRHFLDRYRVARGRTVYRPGCERRRTPGPATRREYPLRSTPCRRSGFDGGRMAERSE